jgi:hypothetical protein
MIELAWLWVRHQPDSALSGWFPARVVLAVEYGGPSHLELRQPQVRDGLGLTRQISGETDV